MNWLTIPKKLTFLSRKAKNLLVSLYAIRKCPYLIWTILIVEAIAVVLIQQPWRSPDSTLYLELAQNLSGPGFVADGSPNSLRVPAYPWFLNLMLFRLGLPTAVVIGLQMLLYLASIWLIAYKVMAPTHRLPFLCLAMIYPFPFFYSATLMTEALAIFCVAVVVALLCNSKTIPGFALAGAVTGLGALIRTDILPILIAVVAVAAYRRRLAGTGAAIVATFVVLLPYMVWNQQTFGRFTPVPISSTIGQSLYLASWESTLELEDLVYLSGGLVTNRAERSGFAPEVRRLHGSEEFKAAAIERIRANPMDAVAHSVKAVWRLFNTASYPRLNPVFQIISNGVWLLGVVGMILAVRKRRPLIPLILLLAMLIPHMPLHTEARYTAPLRLILLLYAAIAVASARMRVPVAANASAGQGVTSLGAVDSRPDP